MSGKWTVVAFLCFIVSSPKLWGQATDANLVGRVTDPTTGNALAGATIEVTRWDASVSATVSDDDGRFSLPPLEPGAYRLQVALDGFFTLDEPLVLQPRDALRLSL